MSATKKRLMRWNQALVCREFGMDPRTAGKRLAALELGNRKEWSTQEVFRAMAGDMYGEKLRLTREQADKVALENAENRRDLVSSAEEQEILERGLSAMTQVVLAASNLENEDKDKLLNQLREAGQSVVQWLRGPKITSPAQG